MEVLTLRYLQICTIAMGIRHPVLQNSFATKRIQFLSTQALILNTKKMVRLILTFITFTQDVDWSVIQMQGTL